ncbi:MAG: peptidylprolyl isomerase [Pseudomonadota bacterium]
MHKLGIIAACGLICAPVAGPALATGIDIQVAGVANGTISIDLLEDVAPKHVEQMTALAEQGFYDDVYFHRVINGFMAQTGDGENAEVEDGNTRYAGTGGSEMPDLNAEFSNISFERGIVGMARSSSPNSANSQFFIVFDDATFLDGQYTVVGRVTSGMDIVDKIKKGDARTGAITGEPDRMVKVTVTD